MPVRKILIVDDSKTEVHYLTELLVREGYVVRTAFNGDDALRLLQEETPDLILMDVVMPGRNGFHLTRTISRDPRWTDVPIIICSSKDQETDKVWALRQGARDYVVKPVEAQVLLSKIRGLG